MNPFPKEPSGTTGKSPWFQPWDEAGLEPLKGERKKGTGPACSFVPDGTRFLDAPNPAMNRWAILKRPSGTGFAAELDQHRLKSAIRALPHRPATILPAQRGLTYQGNRGIHDYSLDGNGHKEAQNAQKDSDFVLLAPPFGQQIVCSISRSVEAIACCTAQISRKRDIAQRICRGGKSWFSLRFLRFLLFHPPRRLQLQSRHRMRGRVDNDIRKQSQIEDADDAGVEADFDRLGYRDR